MSGEPHDPNRLKLWGWIAVVLTVVVALVYVLIAKPWSTYDGKKPKSVQHHSSLAAATASWLGPAASSHLSLGRRPA